MLIVQDISDAEDRYEFVNLNASLEEEIIELYKNTYRIIYKG